MVLAAITATPTRELTSSLCRSSVVTLGLLVLVLGCEGGGPSQRWRAVRQAKVARGEKLYLISCGTCHGPDGAGKPGVASPLARSGWVLGPEGRLIRIALHGVRGEIEVIGKTYNLEMPAFHVAFRDADIAAILTYIRQAWGNSAPPVETATVAELRAAHAERGDSWVAEELLAVE